MSQVRTLSPGRGCQRARLGGSWMPIGTISSLLRKHLWQGFLALGLALAGVYFLFPRGGLTQGVLYVTLGVSMTCAIAIGIRIYRPTPRLPWYLLLAGIGLYTTVANGIWYLYPVGLGKTLPYPSAADAVYLIGYLFELAGFVAFIRVHAGRSDRTAVLDTALITLGVGILSWDLLMQPYIELHGLSLIARVVSIAYPAVDILLLAVLIRFAFVPGARSLAQWFLIAYFVGELFSDTTYAITSLKGTFYYGHPLVAGWMVSYAFLGAAVLHPSMRSLTDRLPQKKPTRSVRRTTLLAGAALVPLALLVWENAVGDNADIPVVAAVCAVMFLLVVLRLRSLTVDISELDRTQAALEESEHKFRSIIETANEAVVGMDRDGLITKWNRQAETTFGWPRDEAIGRVLADTIIPVRHREGHRNGLERFLATGEARVLNKRLEFEALHRDGHEFPVELTISAIKVEGSVRFVGFVHDITERKKGEEALRQSEATLRAVFAASPDIVTLLGPDGQLGAPSAGVTDVLGYELGEYVAMDRTSLVHPDDREIAAQVRLVPLEAGKTVQVRFRIRHADGRWVMLETRAQAMTDEGGRPMGAVAVSRDVTKTVALEEALSSAKDEADRANRAKSEFLSRMSHELRTPLNAVLGFGQLLEMDGLEGEDAESVQQILKGGRHLLELINEVLDIARIESGKLRMSMEPIQMATALRETIELIRPLAADRRIELRTEGSWSIERCVKADHQRLKQVVLNLLSNAVKYNREGGTVTVRCLEANGRRLRVEVSDDGPGIRPEFMERLFVPFDRLGAEASGVEGTGLGLALSKGLIEAMGGALGAESALGQGSTFFIELPLATPVETSADSTLAEESLAIGAPADSYMLLYIEDNLANLKLIEGALNRRPGLTLLTAMQGSVGLDLARQHRPDLILLDLHLPDVPGQELLRHLQADPTTRDIPVIVISADATPGQIENLLAAGAHAYLTKPIDVSRFFQLVDGALADRRFYNAV
jgi:PAS domain S-box-containing protein